jgi:beta-glucosidase
MARILCGLVNPSGKLSESFPSRYLDNPSALNYPGEDRKVVYGERQFIGYRSYEKRNLEVRFPFGHGLSYTDFMYSGLELGVDADGVDVRFKLTNTGRSAGKETVQVYVGDMNPALARPVKELKAFEKIHLDAGESKDIVLRVPLREFAYYDDRIMAWRVRPGWYGVHIGSSSSDIRLKDKVQLNPKTPKLPVTGETYLAELREDKEAWRLFKKTVGIIKFKVAFENPANIMLKLMYNSPLRAIFTQIPGLNRRKLGQFLAKVNHGESSDDK